ncbi:hypothetical protein OGH69_18130 [Flavobacterium sp. MFBS3-15]|uniref:hypothetical protein n=1 Tax=Flavobacterium sp. MFBS3-15 TaxID=2989816 RepID=UPI0022360063|nr:hypothetical protein [Flavobacterium sp. MFBS3-15]MCW4470892.1 hypothetical protein [Flavobacterium sp. MFBS3-15]
MNERIAEIVKRFGDSWADTEKFYDAFTAEGHWGKVQPIIKFISDLKQKGYDKYFRLGTSVDMLIISRSVEHGLRNDQKHIKIYAYQDYLDVTFREGDKVYRHYEVNDLSDERVLKLLETLMDTMVD